MRFVFKISFALIAAVVLAACSETVSASPAEAPSPDSPFVEYRSWDTDSAVAQAIAYVTAVEASTTTTTAAPPRRSTNVVQGVLQASPGADRWDQLAQCETGGNWAANTGNGFGGGLQFMHQGSYSTWLSFGGGEFAANPWDATREQQIVVAERVLASSGWNAWPGCSRRFGWIG